MTFSLKQTQSNAGPGHSTGVNIGTAKQKIDTANVPFAAGQAVHLYLKKSIVGATVYDTGRGYYCIVGSTYSGIYRFAPNPVELTTVWTPAYTAPAAAATINSASFEFDDATGIVSASMTINGVTHTCQYTDPTPEAGLFGSVYNGTSAPITAVNYYEWIAAPGAPSNPHTTALGSTTATLACDAPATGGAVVSYELDWRKVGATAWVTVSSPDGSAMLAGLEPETEYEQRWRALGTQSTVSPSSAVTTFLTHNLATGGGEIVPVLVIDPSGLPASVTITDEDAIAVAGATVVAQPGSIGLGTSSVNGIVSVAGLAAGNYTLTATKGSGTGSANIRLEGGPVITSPATFSRVENTTMVATLVASDPNNDPITWAILPGGDAALFAIGSTTGVLAFVTAPDFESPGDLGGNNVYELTVSATSNAQTVTQAITITITNGPEVITEVHLVEPQSGLIRGRPGIPVRMRCLDQLARPAEGVTISAQPGTVYVPGNPSIYIGVTDAQGYCVWENPPLGQFIGIAFFDNGL